MGELHDLPAADRHRPRQLARLNEGRQIHQTVGVDGTIGGHPPGHRRHVALADVAIGFQLFWSRHLHRRALQPLGRIARGHLAPHALAGPPFLVENPQLQPVFLGGVQADADIAKPVRSEPVVVRARLGGKAAVAALGDLVGFQLEALLGLVAVQPEERANQAPRV